MSRSYRLAVLAVALIIALLLWWGLELLFIPPIYKLARMPHPLLYYEGHIAIALAVLMAWFHSRLALGILWLCAALHRAASALLVAGAIGIDAGMHVFSIPHPEGWWISVLGGSAFASGLFSWLERLRRKG